MYEIVTTDLLSENIVEAHFSGQFQSETIFKFIDCLGEYENKYPSNNLLIDISNMTSGPDLGQIKSLVQYVKETGKRQGKMAFVTGEELMRSVLVKLIVDLISVFKPNQVAAFKSTEEAKSWLCPCDT